MQKRNHYIFFTINGSISQQENKTSYEQMANTFRKICDLHKYQCSYLVRVHANITHSSIGHVLEYKRATAFEDLNLTIAFKASEPDTSSMQLAFANFAHN